jgi:hypothetical protein
MMRIITDQPQHQSVAAARNHDATVFVALELIGRRSQSTRSQRGALTLFWAPRAPASGHDRSDGTARILAEGEGGLVSIFSSLPARTKRPPRMRVSQNAAHFGSPTPRCAAPTACLAAASPADSGSCSR